MYYYSIIYWRDFRTAWQTGQLLWYTNSWLTCYNNVSSLFTSTFWDCSNLKSSQKIFSNVYLLSQKGLPRWFQGNADYHKYTPRKELFSYLRDVGRSARWGGRPLSVVAPNMWKNVSKYWGWGKIMCSPPLQILMGQRPSRSPPPRGSYPLVPDHWKPLYCGKRVFKHCAPPTVYNLLYQHGREKCH